MPEYKYAVTIQYRSTPLEEAPRGEDGDFDFEDPEFWDGQARVPITTDTPIFEGSDELSIQQLQDIHRQIGEDENNDYQALIIAVDTNSGNLMIEDLNDD